MSSREGFHRQDTDSGAGVPRARSPRPSSSPPPAYVSPRSEKIIAPRMAAGGSGQQEEPPASRKAVIASVSFYLVAALVMVTANKWVLQSAAVPLAFLTVQLFMAVALMHLFAPCGLIKIPEVRLSVCKGLIPLIAMNCLGLAANTYCLQYVDASFYQVARGLVLPFTVLLTFLMLSSKPSRPVLGAIAIVCIGYFIGVANENINESFIGIVLGVVSSMTTAGHAVVVKRSLPVVNGSAMDLTYFANLLSALVLLPAVILAETGPLLSLIANGGEGLRTFVVGSTVTGIFGFLICVAGFISIKVTSPITHMISAAVRGIIQTWIGVSLFNDTVTTGRMSSIAVVLGGSILYTWLKDRELRQKEAQKATNGSSMPMSATSVRVDAEARDGEADALLEADELIRESERDQQKKGEA